MNKWNFIRSKEQIEVQALAWESIYSRVYRVYLWIKYDLIRIIIMVIVFKVWIRKWHFVQFNKLLNGESWFIYAQVCIKTIVKCRCYFVFYFTLSKATDSLKEQCHLGISSHGFMLSLSNVFVKLTRMNINSISVSWDGHCISFPGIVCFSSLPI